MYDLIIIGGGPAGAAAGVYAGRKRLKTALITESFGGQSIVSDDIQNWIGIKSISGFELAKNLEEHVRAQETVEIISGDKVNAVKEISGGYEVATDTGKSLSAKALIITSGGRRRKLGVPGEDLLNGKGVAYCSTCDAPLFSGRKVAVVGGGNAGLEAVIDLLPYATEVFLIVRGDKLAGDPITQAEVQKSEKVKILWNTSTKEIIGEKFVTQLKLDRAGKEEMLDANGIFIEIGSVPNSEFVKGLVELNKFGEIITDHKLSTTSKPGIFAAGDVTDDPYKQNNISVGDAVIATLSAYNYLLNHEKSSSAADLGHN